MRGFTDHTVTIADTPLLFRLLNHGKVATVDKNWKLSNQRKASCLACQTDDMVVS